MSSLDLRPCDRKTGKTDRKTDRISFVKEIQTRPQFCVNISMYFIDKIIQ